MIIMNEMYLTGINLNGYQYTDLGYRARYNIFNKTDTNNLMQRQNVVSKTFYDIQPYNHDVWSQSQHKSKVAEPRPSIGVFWLRL